MWTLLSESIVWPAFYITYCSLCRLSHLFSETGLCCTSCYIFWGRIWLKTRFRAVPPHLASNLTSSLIYIYLWVHTYECMHVYVCLCVCTHRCIWKLGVIPLLHPLSVPPSYGFETESLSEPQRTCFGSNGWPPVSALDAVVTGSWSHAELSCGSWNPSSGPRACTSSPTEPPQPIHIKFHLAHYLHEAGFLLH